MSETSYLRETLNRRVKSLAHLRPLFELEADLIHLQIRPDNDFKWVPPHRFNLVADRSIPFRTYAKFVVDTATSLGQGGDKGFFKTRAKSSA